jgi:hypothetical protein
MMHDYEERFAPFKKIIEYDNRQFKEELFPLYRKMLDAFTDNYWLADTDTRAYYQEFLEFVEIWERFLADSLPHEVLEKLEHAEQAILLFYDHLEARLDQLRRELKDEQFVGIRIAGLTIGSSRPSRFRRYGG